MTWIIIIASLIAFLLWILLGPVILFINTDTNRYHFVLPGVIKAIAVPDKELFHIRVWIFFIPFRIHPFKSKPRKRKAKPRKPGSKWRLKKYSGGKQMIGSVIRSMWIKELRLNLDTDDFMLNAWLVPAFSMVNSGNIQMKVNFEGTSSLILDLRARIGTLLWIVVTNKYKSLLNH